MHRPGSASLTLFGIPLISILAFAGAANAQTGQRVNFGINPTVFRAGQPATAELSVCSISSPVPLTLSPGNTFLFIVDGSIGTVLGFTAPVSVTSASLSATDFSVSFGGSQNQINITYNGAAKLFAYGDCLGLKVTLQASPQVGSGKLSLSSQFVSAVNGNLPFVIVSVLDFANTGMSAVAHDPSLTGDGTGAAPLGVAPGGITNPDLAAGAVTTSKIAAGQVVKGVTVGASTVTDNVTLAAGPNVTITPAGNTLTIAATGGGGGGGSSILNQKTLQPGADFNISGDGSVGGTLSGNAVSATVQYNLGGFRFLSGAGRGNLFVGGGAGIQNAPVDGIPGEGIRNTFVGSAAGVSNTSGGFNSFFGTDAGHSNKQGSGNSFFGGQAGLNTDADSNSFFGTLSGNQNTTGSENTFVGTQAGNVNKTGSRNTYIGVNAGGLSDLVNATAIGAGASVLQNDSLVLGNFFTKVGIGTSRPTSKLTVDGLIETTVGGGIKFGDGSIQTTAASGGGGVPPGSANYIQSNPSSQQAGANFNISGDGTAGGTLSANAVNAATQYNLGGQPVLRVTALGSSGGASFYAGGGAGLSSGPTAFGNTFVGESAGVVNTTGTQNSIFGSSAGFFAAGSRNSIFGYFAGFSAVEGSNNSFFGNVAGAVNRVSNSSFFGALAGENNTTGIQNSFFGYKAGNANVAGCCGSYFGFQAGQMSTGNDNSFFGNNAGPANTTGSHNSFFGSAAGLANDTGGDNAFFGVSAGRNNLGGSVNTFVGAAAGFQNTGGSFNAFFGQAAGLSNTTGRLNSLFGQAAGLLNTTGISNAFFGNSAGLTNTTGSNNTIVGTFADLGANNLTNATAIGANALATQSNTLVLGSINGVNGATADTNVGIGTSAPGSKLTVVGLIETKAGGVKFPDGTIQTSAAAGGSAITQITAGAGLTGGGTTGNVTLSVGAGQGISVAPGAVSIADLGVTTAKLADASVTGPKIALGQVVRNLNGLTDSVTLAAGANITITPAGNTLTIASTGGGGGASILNQASLQAGANFNIDGLGTAHSFNSAVGYSINNSSVLRTLVESTFVGVGAGAPSGGAGFSNSFLGLNAGNATATGSNNAFFGAHAGEFSDADGNAFFGFNAGKANHFGSQNSFFGMSAGLGNGDGSFNSFFGSGAGNTSTGDFNSFVGYQSGQQNQGTTNSFFGARSGNQNTTGAGNVFVGFQAGEANIGGNNDTFIGNSVAEFFKTGNNNTFVGASAGICCNADNSTFIGAGAQPTNPGFTNATAIGANATVAHSNALVLGSINGLNGATADTNVGIGTTMPATRLHVVGDVTLSGNVTISGTLVKPAGSFKIDHPLDPENKTLSHSFVESPDMKNIYDGVVNLDSNGEATVTLPEYFQALNRDFRYQLTAIGAPGPNLFIAEEISNNRFKIAGGKPGSKVSWQVTGVRHDAYADAHRIRVEEDKPASERGSYLNPDVFKRSKGKGTARASESH